MEKAIFKLLGVEGPVTLTSWPVRASQIFAVLSELPVTIRTPSGKKLTLVTSSACPLSFSRGVPVRAVPDVRRLVTTAGDDPRPVGGETHARDRARVPLQFEQGHAGARIPDLRRTVKTAGDDPRPVGGETHAVDLARVPLEFEQGRAGRASPRPSPYCPDCR